MKKSEEAAVARVRKAWLAFPDTAEKLSHGAPAFFVKGKLFLMMAMNHHGDGRFALWCAAPEGAQNALVGAEPEHFFVPPYVGKGGWLGVRLDTKLAWPTVLSMIEQACRTRMQNAPARGRRAGVPPASAGRPARR